MFLEMAKFTQIEVDFSDDETVNFGKRSEFLPSDSLFRLRTLATVTSTEEVTHSPTFFGRSKATYAAVVIDSVISVFTVSNFEFVLTADFGTNIRSVCVVDDLSLVLVFIGESSIELHFLSLVEKKVVFSRKILSTNKAIEPNESMRHSRVFDAYYKKDKLVVIYVSNADRSFHVLQYQINKSKNWWRQPFCVSASLSLEFCEFQVEFCGCLEVDHFFIIGSSVATLTFANNEIILENSVDLLFDDVCLTYGEIICNSAFLTCFDTIGNLYIFDVQTLILLKRFKFDARPLEFCIFDAVNDSNFSLQKFKVAIVHETLDRAFLEIRSVFEDELLYKYETSNGLTLAGASIANDDIFFLESAKTHLSTKFSDEIRIRIVEQSNAIDKLNRLIEKQNFRDAEQFALLFRLDSQIIFQAESEFLLNSKATIDRLIKCLTKISDEAFIADFCSKAILPDFDSYMRLLQFAVDRLKKTKNDNTAKSSSSLTKINEILYRLKTFRQLFVDDDISLNEAWKSLKTLNFDELFVKFVKIGQFEEATLILQRHWLEICSKLNEGFLLKIFLHCEFHPNMPKVVEFLKEDFLPLVLLEKPELVEVIAKFLIEQAFATEFQQEGGFDEDFPTNALKYANILQEIFDKFVESMKLATPFEFARVAYVLSMMNVKETSDEEGQTTVRRLRRLVWNLKEMKRLELVYNLKMAYAEFEGMTDEALVFFVLDKVRILEMLEKSVQRVVLPLVDEKHMNFDDVLLKYIQVCLERNVTSSEDVGFSGKSDVELRIGVLYKFLKRVESKCICALKLLDFAKLPLSTDLQKIVENVRTFRHRLVQKVDEKLRYLELKSILCKYDLPSSYLTSPRTIIKNILSKRQTFEALEDAVLIVDQLKCSSRIECYVFALNRLLIEERFDELKLILRGLIEDERNVCVRRLMGQIRALAEFDRNEATAEESIVQFTQFTKQLEALNEFIVDKCAASAYAELKWAFRAMSVLRTKFQIFVAFSEIVDNVEFGFETFRRFVEAKPEEFALIGDLASLLELDQRRVCLELLDIYIRQKDWTNIFEVIENCDFDLFDEEQIRVFKKLFRSMLNCINRQSVTLGDSTFDSIKSIFGFLLLRCGFDEEFGEICDAYKLIVSSFCSTSSNDTSTKYFVTSQRFSQQRNDFDFKSILAKFSSLQAKTSPVLFNVEDDFMTPIKLIPSISIANSSSELSRIWTKCVESYLTSVAFERNADLFFCFSLILTLSQPNMEKLLQRLETKLHSSSRRKRQVLMKLRGALFQYLRRNEESPLLALKFYNLTYFFAITRQIDAKRLQFVDASSLDDFCLKNEQNAAAIVDYYVRNGQLTICANLFKVLFDVFDFGTVLIENVKQRLVNLNVDEIPSILRTLKEVEMFFGESSQVGNLVEAVEQVLHLVDQTFYELFEYLLNFLTRRRNVGYEEWKRLLAFLFQYEKNRRRSSTSKRLPFPCLSDTKSVEKFWTTVMKREVCFENLQMWREVYVEFFSETRCGVSELRLLLAALKNEASASTNETSAKIEFDSETMRKISTELHNSGEFQKSLEFLIPFAHNIADPNLQLEAYCIGISLIEKWHQVVVDAGPPEDLLKTEKLHKDLERFVRKLKTKNCLTAFDVLDHSSEKLLDQPARLIKFLLGNEKLLVDKRRILSRVVEKVAEFNNVDLGKLYDFQLNLYFFTNDNEENTLILSSSGGILNDLSKISSKDLNRICLLSEGRQAEDVAFYFMSVAKSQDIKVSSSAKVLALRALFWFFTPAELNQLSVGTPEQCCRFLADLTYLNWLEKLGIPKTLQSFDACNKLELVHSVIKNLNKQSINVTISLIVDFSLKDEVVISEILKFCTSINISGQLTASLLRFIYKNTDLWSVSDLATFWKRIVKQCGQNPGLRFCF